MRSLLIVAVLLASGCAAQLKDSFAKHLTADQDSAKVTRGWTAKLRLPPCTVPAGGALAPTACCDDACRSAALAGIDAQADSVSAAAVVTP